MVLILCDGLRERRLVVSDSLEAYSTDSSFVDLFPISWAAGHPLIRHPVKARTHLWL